MFENSLVNTRDAKQNGAVLRRALQRITFADFPTRQERSGRGFSPVGRERERERESRVKRMIFTDPPGGLNGSVTRKLQIPYTARKENSVAIYER